MAALSHFSDDVSEEQLNALIEKAISEKTKIARKCLHVLVVLQGFKLS